jgi:hypothetical protein
MPAFNWLKPIAPQLKAYELALDPGFVAKLQDYANALNLLRRAKVIKGPIWAMALGVLFSRIARESGMSESALYQHVMQRKHPHEGR